MGAEEALQQMSVVQREFMKSFETQHQPAPVPGGRNEGFPAGSVVDASTRCNSAEYAAWHNWEVLRRKDPAKPSEVGVHFFEHFCQL